jgi:hypothetical protein
VTDGGLTVAVTGPTGTFGSGLVPLLQDDDRIAQILGIARRPFDPGPRGWTKMTYRPSVAAYGFGADLPVSIDEDWPVRPAARLFYARE